MTVEDVKRNFISNLNKLMSDYNKTQSDIAKIAGVSQGTVSEWLAGKKYPRMDKIQRIVDHFNIPMTALVNDGKGPAEQYYLDPETARLAQELKDNPNYRVLMDASRTLSPEAVKEVMKFIDYQKAKEEPWRNED